MQPAAWAPAGWHRLWRWQPWRAGTGRYFQSQAPRGWTCFPRVAIRSPGVNSRPARAARDFAIATLQRWGAAERTEDVAVVVSELVTNAFRHALPDSGESRPGSLIRLGLLQPGPCVLCAVADPSVAAPVAKEADLLAETGRGLHVVGALADTWGYTTAGDMGKVVWAMFSADRERGISPVERRRRSMNCRLDGLGPGTRRRSAAG